MIALEHLATEQRNPASRNIDTLPTLDILRIINAEDRKIAPAIDLVLPQIAAAVEKITHQLQAGGRLIYVGAGTSGRLGVLDAAECPPTYGTPAELVQGIIAGGRDAMFIAQEGAEDSPSLAVKDLKTLHFNSQDVLVGLAASGRTPYVVGALQYAQTLAAPTIAITCSPDSPAAAAAEIPITVLVGPEVVTGSTRMKAGTAQKLVLNMLSTATMIRLGKVYGNLMIDVKASNKKLEERARHIVMEATGCCRSDAIAALQQADGRAKLAVFMLLSGKRAAEARDCLAAANGYVAQALAHLKKGDPTL